MFKEKRSRESVYTVLVDKLHLTPEDRQSLRIKRGFSDSTIDQLKFKSTGPYIAPIIERMKEEIHLQSLHESGIIAVSERPVKQLIEPGKIVIPYLDLEGDKVEYLKCHKNGNLPDQGVAVYCSYIARKSDSMVVLCESEFKAASMHQLGFNAYGLGGVATFVGKHFDNLMEKIKDKQVVIIMFDTEIQDDPSLPTFKNNPQSRYAHLTYAYYLGKKIEIDLQAKNLQRPEVQIARLPKEWVKDGKVDCDSALAAGKTREQFQMVLGDAVNPETFRRLMDIAPQDRPWVLRALERAEHSRTFWTEQNCYWTVRYKTEGKAVTKVPVRMSNFKIKIINTVYKGQDVFREVQLKNKYEDISSVFVLTNKEMSNFKSFKELCLGRGDYQWTGTDRDWDQVVESLFLENPGSPVHMLEKVGRIEEENMWAFQDLILKDDGTEIPLSPDGATFIDANKGWRIQPISIAKEGKAMVPNLSTKPIDPIETLENFQKAFGDPGVTAFFYSISGLFTEEVHKHYQAFPFCMIYGEAQAGKSTLTDLMVSLAGIPRHVASMNISDTTGVAMGRKLSYYSSLPVKFDEYRTEDKKTSDKASFIRSIYNRQSASKGIRDPFGVREVAPLGNMIISGEELPSDPALYSRMIPIRVEKVKTEDTRQAVMWLQEHYKSLSYVSYMILKNYKTRAAKFIQDIEDTRKGLASSHKSPSDFRIQIHYAMILAAVFQIVDDPIKIHEIVKILNSQFVEVSIEQKNETIVGKFFRDLVVMKNSGEKVKRYLSMCKPPSLDAVMYLPGVHADCIKWRHQRGEKQSLSSEKTVREYIKSKPYVKSMNSKHRVESLDGDRARCVLIDLYHPDCPEVLRELFQGIQYYEKGEAFDEIDN